METKANYIVVGIFTLVAVLAAFGFVYWTAGIGDRGDTVTLRVRIPGSASGLGRGSAVLFNGVKVGDVTRVFIDVQNPSAAIADTTIDRFTPITRSTEADIGLAGLTGQANIELKGGNLQEPNLLDEAEAQGRVAEITADPSAVTNLLQTAQDIFKRADTVITNLEGFVGSSRGPLEQTVKNAETFSDALARNAAGIDKFLVSVSDLSTEVSKVSGRLDQTLSSAQGLLDAVDRAKVQAIVANAETFSSDLSAAGQRVNAISARVDAVVASADTIVRSFNDTAKTVNEVARQSQGTLAKVDGILDGVDPATLRSALTNIEETSRSANTAAASIRDLSQRATPIFDNVGKVAERIGSRADDIDLLIADAGALAGRLNQASTRLNSVVERADGILGGVDPATLRSALTNIEETSRSANTAAANIRDLSQRATPIFDNVGKVAERIGNRADDIDLLIADAGALTGRLNQASTRLGSVVGRADDILGGVDPAAVKSALTNIEETSRSANTAAASIRDLSQRATPIFDNVGKVAERIGNRADDIDLLIADAGALAGRLNQASTRLNSVVEQADAILGGVDPNAVRSSIANIQQATVTANGAITTFRDVGQTAANVANDVSRVTQGLAGRSEEINQFVTDSGQLAGRLNAASVRVDGILARVDDLLGSDQANGLVAEAGETLRAFRQVADTLNGRIGPIADNFARFSSQGLNDVRSLVQESQRAVNRIEGAVDDIQRNPQRILSGGDGEVRRFNGRARR